MIAVLAAAWVNWERYIPRGFAAARSAIATASTDAGFAVTTIHLSGNRHAPPNLILRKLGFRLGQSIFSIDPQRARANLRTLRWVSNAEVSRRYPDTVDVRIVEKTPFALWQSPHGLYVVDRDGRAIAKVRAPRFRHLPLFFGGRPDGASGLVAAIRSHRAVAARVKAMQRVSARRWNLILDDGVLVKLPERGWAKQLDALERLIVKGALERDIAEIDLRSRDNAFFVLRHPAPRKTAKGEPA